MWDNLQIDTDKPKIKRIGKMKANMLFEKMKNLWKWLFGTRKEHVVSVSVCPNCKGTDYISSNNAISLCVLCGGKQSDTNVR